MTEETKNKTSTEAPLTDEQKTFKHRKKLAIAICSGIAVALGIYLEAIDLTLITAMFASAE